MVVPSVSMLLVGRAFLLVDEFVLDAMPPPNNFVTPRTNPCGSLLDIFTSGVVFVDVIPLYVTGVIPGDAPFHIIHRNEA